jgi:hypothetical protein
MTPDSSRFWSAEDYEPGRPQSSFDKQPLRDFLEAERRAGHWNGEAPAPYLPLELVQRPVGATRRLFEGSRASIPQAPLGADRDISTPEGLRPSIQVRMWAAEPRKLTTVLSGLGLALSVADAQQPDCSFGVPRRGTVR